jgi:hypothetical protein
MGKDAAVVSELLRALIRRDGEAVAAMVTDDFTFDRCRRRWPPAASTAAVRACGPT